MARNDPPLRVELGGTTKHLQAVERELEVAGRGRRLEPAQLSPIWQARCSHGQTREELAAGGRIHCQVQMRDGRRHWVKDPALRKAVPGHAKRAQGREQTTEWTLEEPRITMEVDGVFRLQGKPRQKEPQRRTGCPDLEDSGRIWSSSTLNDPGLSRPLDMDLKRPKAVPHPARIIGLKPTRNARTSRRHCSQEQRTIADRLGTGDGDRIQSGSAIGRKVQ